MSFKSYIAEAKNTHMTHIEDMILDGGKSGATGAIKSLESLLDMLSGSASSGVNVTVKWDGAPAVFAGIDPNDGEFFVAKKGIFNKNPKVYKSHDDVDNDTSGDLADKLKVAYTELKKLDIKGVIQGDIMFTKPDLKAETIDGEKYVTFHPNTIVYAVPKDQASDISNANIGVVFHTTYSGDSFEEMKASFSVDMSKLKKTKSVWMRSADLYDLSGTASLTAEETKSIESYISKAKSTLKKISKNTMSEVSSNKDVNMLINTFNNTKVRSAERITDTSRHTAELISWIENRFQKDIDKLKTEKGKGRKVGSRDKVLSFFSSDNKKNLIMMFDLQNLLVDAKEILITKLDTILELSTFVKTKDGFKVTGAEGFVAIDDTGSAVKLVNRLEFSTNNFSSDIIKGWMK